MNRIGVVLAAAILLVSATSAVAQSVTIKATGRMFFTDIILNDRMRLRAMVDTGASFLGFCGSIASNLNLQLGASVTVHTANGHVPTRRATVASLRIDALELRNVDALVDDRQAAISCPSSACPFCNISMSSCTPAP